MNKLILSVFFVLFFITPFSLVNAEQKTERWVCLKAEQIPNSHVASVSVDPEAKLLVNSETFVFECLANSECTSGNAAVDQQVFGRNNLQTLKNQLGYVFQESTISSNPLMSDGGGNIPTFTWKSYTPVGHERRWLALNYFVPSSDNTPTGKDKSQQLGTFSFESAVNQSDCVSLAWDPYGRVFDSKTLEPINKATVTLFKKRVDGTFTLMTPADLLGGNILNPQITKEDGGYSMVVPNGTYKLTASHNNYTFPEQIINLQTNYPKIYSDIYPDQTGEEIVQKGTIQHRDIPLKQDSVGPENEIKVMEYFYDLHKPTSTAIVKGRVSHPFAKINAYSKKGDPISKIGVRYKLLTKSPISADRLGNFVVRINEAQFLKTEYFGQISVEKIDLTQPGLVGKIKQWLSGFTGKVNAQTLIASSIEFEPILNYLEGYAYDAQGEVLPSSTVSIYLDFSSKPSYQTKTDDKGYYRISSEFLPSMPYRITYTTAAGQVIKTSTSQFIAQNSDFIATSEVKINQFTDKAGRVITPPPEKISGTVDNNKDLNKSSSASVSSKSLTTSLLLVLIIIILFVLLVVVAVAIFLKQRKNTIL